MRKEMDRALVKGYLRASGKNIVNGDGDTVLLNGWGVGNWLLSEGYMWLGGGERFDRPRTIENAVRELTGTKYSEYFWKEFRSRYLTKEDVRLMAELGYNSVRIPFNWRVFLENEPGLNWVEEGFRLIDRCLDWCEEYKIYAILDMHGAPGGQTGAGIDDSFDDMPRLFIDADSWAKAIALWSKIAERYADRWIVGAYDLLNEPVRQASANPPRGHCDEYIPKLARFYDEVIPAIRKYDKNHMLTLEGHYWAKTPDFFVKRFDDNMAIHFHLYGWIGGWPELKPFQGFLDVSEKLDQPLWIGETGENLNEWYTAMFQLMADLGIGYCSWTWKKMQCKNSPLSVKKPRGWDDIIGFTKLGPRPSYENAQSILNEYLDNMLAENCESNIAVSRACFRRPGTVVRGTDFDLFPGKGVSFSGTRAEPNPPAGPQAPESYRRECGMRIKEGRKMEKRPFFWDTAWESFTLELTKDEFAIYSLHDAVAGSSVSFEIMAVEDAELEITSDGKSLGHITLDAGDGVVATEPLAVLPLHRQAVKMTVKKGIIELDKVIFE